MVCGTRGIAKVTSTRFCLPFRRQPNYVPLRQGNEQKYTGKAQGMLRLELRVSGLHNFGIMIDPRRVDKNAPSDAEACPREAGFPQFVPLPLVDASLTFWLAVMPRSTLTRKRMRDHPRGSSERSIHHWCRRLPFAHKFPLEANKIQRWCWSA